MGYSTTEIDFLDVTVTKVGDKSETNLYCKSTDTHDSTFMHNHVNAMYKKSIPYGQAVRIKWIWSKEEKRNSRLEQLKQWLVNRGYKEDHDDLKSKIDREKCFVSKTRQKSWR